MVILELARALNRASVDFEIGHLQEIRVRLRSLKRAPGRALFSSQTIRGDYAFHVGGRTELQFNIGSETHEQSEVIRHGVAFSLETSQTLPTIEPLLPKIALFNDYVRSHPEDFPGMRMWHYKGNRRSDDRPVGPISDDLIRPGIFVMLGRHAKVDEVDVQGILADFDRLLTLYAYVESDSHGPKLFETRDFEPGCPRFAETATAVFPGRTVDVALRHKEVQRVLYDLLCHEAGKENVQVEHPLNFGVRVDAAVRQSGKLVFYEVKIAPTAQSCVRAALGQLLEYAHWPSVERASEIVVVGEAPLDSDGQAYLRFLRKQYTLPLWYRQIDFDGRVLGDKS
jgi:hypothetical protein